MQLKINSLFKKADKEKYDKYLELMPDFKKEKTQKFTTVVLTLIAFIILLIFAINPTFTTIANLQKQLEDARFVEEKLSQKIDNLILLQTKYNNLQNDLPIVFDAVPKKPESILLAGQIQSLARESNLTIVAMQITDVFASKVNNYSYFTYDITARGKYEDMLNFIKNVAIMQRILTVENIMIKKQTQVSTEQTTVVLQINIGGNGLFKE